MCQLGLFHRERVCVCVCVCVCVRAKQQNTCQLGLSHTEDCPCLTGPQFPKAPSSVLPPHRRGKKAAVAPWNKNRCGATRRTFRTPQPSPKPPAWLRLVDPSQPDRVKSGLTDHFRLVDPRQPHRVKSGLTWGWLVGAHPSRLQGVKSGQTDWPLQVSWCFEPSQPHRVVSGLYIDYLRQNYTRTQKKNKTPHSDSRSFSHIILVTQTLAPPTPTAVAPHSEYHYPAPSSKKGRTDVNQCLEFAVASHSEHRFPAPFSKEGRMSLTSAWSLLLHRAPSIAFWHLPPKKEGCRKPVLGVCCCTLPAVRERTSGKPRRVGDRDVMNCQPRTSTSTSTTTWNWSPTCTITVKIIIDPSGEHISTI